MMLLKIPPGFAMAFVGFAGVTAQLWWVAGQDFNAAFQSAGNLIVTEALGRLQQLRPDRHPHVHLHGGADLLRRLQRYPLPGRLPLGRPSPRRLGDHLDPCLRRFRRHLRLQYRHRRHHDRCRHPPHAQIQVSPDADGGRRRRRLDPGRGHPAEHRPGRLRPLPVSIDRETLHRHPDPGRDPHRPDGRHRRRHLCPPPRLGPPGRALDLVAALPQPATDCRRHGPVHRNHGRHDVREHHRHGRRRGRLFPGPGALPVARQVWVCTAWAQPCITRSGSPAWSS